MLALVRSLSSLLILSLAFAVSVRGQEAHHPSPQTRLLADAADGVLDRFDLPSACLIASGVGGQRELAELQSRLAVALGSIELAASDAPAGEQARAILRQLHERILTGKYDDQATDLRRALIGGDYNCLSALVLYVELCRRADVPLVIRSQPGHVYCELSREQRIEPASRTWLDAQTSALEAAASRAITPVQLVGKVYYNRGITQLERCEFAAGIESLEHACRLDRLDADARTNRLAGLNNWALALVEEGNTSAAAALIARGLTIDPHFAPLVANERLLRARIAAP
jgi:tetratricopeptide (TPR) repeat protein